MNVTDCIGKRNHISLLISDLIRRTVRNATVKSWLEKSHPSTCMVISSLQNGKLSKSRLYDQIRAQCDLVIICYGCNMTLQLSIMHVLKACAWRGNISDNDHPHITYRKSKAVKCKVEKARLSSARNQFVYVYQQKWL